MVEREQTLSRMVQREENIWRHQERVRSLIETARRHAAIGRAQEHARIMSLLNPRPPFENTVSKMADQPRAFQQLTDTLAKSTIWTSPLELPPTADAFPQ